MSSYHLVTPSIHMHRSWFSLRVDRYVIALLINKGALAPHVKLNCHAVVLLSIIQQVTID